LQNEHVPEDFNFNYLFFPFIMADTTTNTTAPVKSQRENRPPRDDKRGGGFKDVQKEFQEELL
jgi:hypothetical protein